MGDVMEGLTTVLLFFVIAFGVTTGLLWLYSRSIKLTVLAITVALLPVVWLLGILPLIGYGIDPMSVLVPFLIFSIGVSHAVQMTNAWKQDVLDGQTALDAAEALPQARHPRHHGPAGQRLGFLVIMLIDIPIVRELGITACLGVAMMIMTNKMFMPIILSHLHLERAALGRSAEAGQRHAVVAAVGPPAGPGHAEHPGHAGDPRRATWQSRQLQTGDVGSGVPELRAESATTRTTSASSRLLHRHGRCRCM
jgi:predicted RND superfamily exporter protein